MQQAGTHKFNVRTNFTLQSTSRMHALQSFHLYSELVLMLSRHALHSACVKMLAFYNACLAFQVSIVAVVTYVYTTRKLQPGSHPLLLT